MISAGEQCSRIARPTDAATRWLSRRWVSHAALHPTMIYLRRTCAEGAVHAGDDLGRVEQIDRHGRRGQELRRTRVGEADGVVDARAGDHTGEGVVAVLVGGGGGDDVA